MNLMEFMKWHATMNTQFMLSETTYICDTILVLVIKFISTRIHDFQTKSFHRILNHLQSMMTKHQVI